MSTGPRGSDGVAAAAPPRVTVADVACRAGVSTSTAARALGDYGTVRPATAARVRAAAKELGYRTNSLARSLITGRTTTLGVIVADVENDFFASLTRGFTDVAAREGFDVVLLNTDEDLDAERVALALLLERRVDGIAVSPASSRPVEHLTDAVAAGPPLLLLDRRVRGLAADLVGIDSVAAARDAVRRLLAFGHRRVGVVTGTPSGGPLTVSTSADRVVGYRQALAEVGVGDAPELVRATGFRRADARAAAADLLALDDPPTALFATDGTLSLGMLEAVLAAGLRVPDDVSLVAVDDPPWASVVRPGLSVVAQPAHALGALAAERLLARIRGRAGTPRRHLLPTEFIGRGSVSVPSGQRRIISAGVPVTTNHRAVSTRGAP